MELDTNILQSKTAANLVEFIERQSKLIVTLKNEAQAYFNPIDEELDAECHDTAHRSNLIIARHQSAVDMAREGRKGGRPTTERRANGRIKF